MRSSAPARCRRNVRGCLDEFDHVFEADIESDRIVGAGELIERPLQIVLVGVQLEEDLLDATAFLEHGPEPVLQHPLLGADVVDPGLQIDGLVAAALDLRKASASVSRAWIAAMASSGSVRASW